MSLECRWVFKILWGVLFSYFLNSGVQQRDRETERQRDREKEKETEKEKKRENQELRGIITMPQSL